MMDILFGENCKLSGETVKLMKRACELLLMRDDILPASGHAGLEVSVTFADEAEIRSLNRDYRNIDEVTDVLSFPLYESEEEIKAVLCDLALQEWDDRPCLSIGDVVLCVSRAESQAAEFGHSFEHEIIYLFLHSILHLLGYDHEDESSEKVLMRTTEKEIMRSLGI